MRPVTLLAALGSAMAFAAPAAAADGERAAIAHERAAIEARYAERERECREHFIVTSCVDDARRDRRRGLDELRARQLKLDEKQRHERAAQRNAELAAKAADDARRDQERAARAASSPGPPGAAVSKPFAPGGSGDRTAESPPHEARDRPLSPAERLGIEPTPRAGDAERRAREEASRASYDARQREAEQHRREVTERAAKRLQSGKPAAPLPVPGSSAPR
ncbi:MAG TPA: hypothetical protein VH041_18080 [Caldimonas sp.]|jgi:hypothetical protein|nr:hypothetical protein [Caldimonas sp.]HEX4236201.1 hypothetical protein [Caldimonas sp.]